MIRYNDDFTKPEVVLIGVAMTMTCSILFKHVGSHAWNTPCVTSVFSCLQQVAALALQILVWLRAFP